MPRMIMFCGVLGVLGLGALAVELAGPSAAQQKTDQILFGLFRGEESVELAPKELARLAAAIRQAKVPRECPLGELTIYVPKGDETWQKALSAARRDVVLQELQRQGLDVAGRLFVNEEYGRLGKFDAGYSAARDNRPPTLTTTSQPKKGSKVQPKDRIVVTMVARDDADRLQTGIESIRLIAESDGGRDVAPTPVRYGPCSDPREKRVVATYEVPANPPPIIRLRAVARDHANYEDFDVAEFPTGDWHGTLIRMGGKAPHQTRARADFVLNHDGKGNLTGTMVGQNETVTASTAPGCISSTKQPNRFRVSLVGSYTEGRALKVFVENVEETGMIVNTKCPNHNTDMKANLGFRSHVWFYQQAFLGTPSPLGEGELLADGTRQYKWEGGASETLTVTLRRSHN